MIDRESLKSMAEGHYPLPIRAEEITALIGYLIAERQATLIKISELKETARKASAEVDDAERLAKRLQNKLSRILGVGTNE